MRKSHNFKHLLADLPKAAYGANHNYRRKKNLTQKEMRNMMRKITIILIVITALLLAGCGKTPQTPRSNDLVVHGSGTIISKEIDVTEFDRLEAGLHFDLTIRHGDDYQLTVLSDDNFIEYIDVKQVGTTLSLGLDPGYAYNIYDVTLQVEATLPDLVGLTLNQSSHAWIDQAFSTDTFTAELTGSGSLEGELQAAKASFKLSGASAVNLSGSAETLRLDSCGNSIANLERFTAVEAVLEVSCNSITSIRVNGSLDVNASQNAQVFYSGEPVSLSSDTFQSALVEKK